MDLENAITKIMEEYATTGRVFFNEAHFQSEFTISLNKKLKGENYKLILEYSPKYKKYRVDLLVIDLKEEKRFIIEFKYVTKTAEIKVADGLFINLKYQGAYDVRRYQIWKDIHKLEDLTDHGKCDGGFFILITNADKLIKEVPKDNLDSEFDISKGTHPSKIGGLYWSYSSPKTEKRYPNKIPIRSQYTFNYSVYSGSKPQSEFKYLVLKIKKK